MKPAESYYGLFTGVFGVESAVNYNKNTNFHCRDARHHRARAKNLGLCQALCINSRAIHLCASNLRGMQVFRLPENQGRNLKKADIMAVFKSGF